MIIKEQNLVRENHQIWSNVTVRPNFNNANVSGANANFSKKLSCTLHNSKHRCNFRIKEDSSKLERLEMLNEKLRFGSTIDSLSN